MIGTKRTLSAIREGVVNLDDSNIRETLKDDRALGFEIDPHGTPRHCANLKASMSSIGPCMDAS